MKKKQKAASNPVKSAMKLHSKMVASTKIDLFPGSPIPKIFRLRKKSHA